MENFEGQQTEIDTFNAIYGEDNILKNLKNIPNFEGILFIPCKLTPPRIIQIPTKRFVRSADLGKTVKFNFIFSEFIISYLPPISLHFKFPPTYPSISPPYFRLTCKWLNFTQLSELCQHLDTIWNQNKSEPVLLNWFEFIKNELFEFLGIKFPYTINLESPKRFHDPRAIQDAIVSTELLEIIENFNETKIYEDFIQSTHYCTICMENSLGLNSIVIRPCGHVFCQSCISKYVSTKIEECRIEILCPESKCTARLTHETINGAVDKEVYAKYDRLLLKSALENMEEIVHCPRKVCGSPAELQLADNSMAICLVCKFCFCPKCRHVYHGISQCRFTLDKMKNMAQDYKKATQTEKFNLQRKFGKSVLRQILSDVENADWIEKNTKKCPKCGVSIEKIHGCSKLLCSHCDTHFCWLCQAVLPPENPYRHYADPLIGGDCVNKLFLGITPEELAAWQVGAL